MNHVNMYQVIFCPIESCWNCKDFEAIIASTGRKYKYSVLNQNCQLTAYPPLEGIEWIFLRNAMREI